MANSKLFATFIDLELAPSSKNWIYYIENLNINDKCKDKLEFLSSFFSMID